MLVPPFCSHDKCFLLGNTHFQPGTHVSNSISNSDNLFIQSYCKNLKKNWQYLHPPIWKSYNATHGKKWYIYRFNQSQRQKIWLHGLIEWMPSGFHLKRMCFSKLFIFLQFIYIYIYIYIYIMPCRQHGYPWPSLATTPYRSSPLAGLQGYIPYPHVAAVRAGHPAFARPYVGVHRSTSLMNSSLLLLLCPAYLVRPTWIVFSI